MPNTSLIPSSDMTTLQDASKCREVAESAEAIHEMMKVAYAINNAANTGELCVTWSGTLMQTTKDSLESAGYKVEAVEDIAREGTRYTISWED